MYVCVRIYSLPMNYSIVYMSLLCFTFKLPYINSLVLTCTLDIQITHTVNILKHYFTHVGVYLLDQYLGAKFWVKEYTFFFNLESIAKFSIYFMIVKPEIQNSTWQLTSFRL